MLSLIPDAVLNWIYWGIIAAGLTGVFAGWVGKFIPFYGKYVGILKPIGVALLVLGVWLRGGYDTEMEWRARVAEMEARVAKAEAESADANARLKDALKGKVKVIRETQIVVQEKIKQDSAKMDAECKLDPVVVEDLNQAAGGKKK